MKKTEGKTNEMTETAGVETTNSGTTHRGLKTRHSQMIALGGCVGTGLFVGTGATLATGGPGFILLAFIVMSMLVHCVVSTIIEITAYLPITGASMSYYAARYVSPSMGVAMGWLYVYSLGILVPYEITAGALVIDYWNSPVNTAVWITIFIIVIIGLNCLPVTYYGESEFWFAAIKVITILGLLILAFVIFWGGGPNQHGILGFHYWKDPGGITTYVVDGPVGKFVAFVETLVLSAFPFVFAPELLLFTSGEMHNPQKDLPKAGRRFTLRLVVFYIGAVLAIGVMCPHDAAALTSGGHGAKSSAFVVGIQNAGIHGLASVVNAVILTTAWSAGSAYLYMSSRALYSLAVAEQAPAIFKKCTKEGVPYMAVISCSFFTLLSYLNCGASSSTVFQWFVNITNTSGFISWSCCCLVYLRFRAAWHVQGKPQLPYQNWTQPYGAWIAMIFFVVLALINGFSVFLPGQFTASGFLTTYIGIPAFLMVYVIHKLWKGRSDHFLLPANEIDIYEGLEHVHNGVGPDLEEEAAQAKE